VLHFFLLNYALIETLFNIWFYVTVQIMIIAIVHAFYWKSMYIENMGNLWFTVALEFLNFQCLNVSDAPMFIISSDLYHVSLLMPALIASLSMMTS
jgi:hypothetical protein